MNTSTTGLSEEQWSRLQEFFWPDVPEDAPEDAYEQAQTAVLQQLTTPEELHQLAWNYNWDDGEQVPAWIIRQSFCDRGTALLLYWRTSPRWYYQYASRDEISKYAVGSYDLLKEIEARYVSGYYTQQNIRFDPTDDEGSDYTKDYTELTAKQSIPTIMNQPSPGRVLERGAF
ncbi:MAG TPA: DUF4274 domain-containing protein [Chloroflexia bacterium]|nr:DUF4274 domain-containing protein [Chloroflexia bacterium]